MKINLPVTQVEIDYPQNTIFVTKTDTQGIITQANDAFVEISGFSREELIGSNHNIVRHPDMPAWAFKNLWDTVKSGHPWRGLVKNRARSGDYYWVKATVSPIMSNGQVIGFMSYRQKPTRAEISSAEELYKSGAIPSQKKTLAQCFSEISLQNKLQLVIQSIVLCVMAIGGYFIISNEKTNMETSAKIHAGAVSNELIDAANLLMVTGQISDSSNRKLLLKKVSSSENILNVRLLRTDQVVKQFGPGLPEERIDDPLQQEVVQTKQTSYYFESKDGKSIIRAITPYVASHNFRDTDCLSCHQVTDGSVNGVSDIKIDISAETLALRHFIVMQIIVQILFQIILFFAIRAIINRFVSIPVKEVKKELEQMVNGNLYSPTPILGRDEMGEVLCNLQICKTMFGGIINQINEAANHVEERSTHLLASMSSVSDSSRLQSDAASSMAAAVEQMSVSIDQISDNAAQVKHISSTSTQLAAGGGRLSKWLLLTCDGQIRASPILHKQWRD